MPDRRQRHWEDWIAGSVIVLSAVFSLAARGQTTTALDALEPLVGRWTSSLDQRYHDHPMIQRFNPDLKPQELEIFWGVERGVLHLKIWNLDRPEEGDRTLFVEGFIFLERETGQARYIEYGGGGTLHRGVFDASDPAQIARTFEGVFKDGSVRNFREIWRWTKPDKSSFEWITLRQVGGEWTPGEVVVDWTLIPGEPNAW